MTCDIHRAVQSVRIANSNAAVAAAAAAVTKTTHPTVLYEMRLGQPTDPQH